MEERNDKTMPAPAAPPAPPPVTQIPPSPRSASTMLAKRHPTKGTSAVAREKQGRVGRPRRRVIELHAPDTTPLSRGWTLHLPATPPPGKVTGRAARETPHPTPAAGRRVVAVECHGSGPSITDPSHGSEYYGSESRIRITDPSHGSESRIRVTAASRGGGEMAGSGRAGLGRARHHPPHTTSLSLLRSLAPAPPPEFGIRG